MNTSDHNPVIRIIRKFGSQKALAEAIGITQPSVSDWVDKGYVPGSRHQQIVDSGRALGIPIAPEDFFRDPSDEMSAAAIGHSD